MRNLCMYDIIREGSFWIICIPPMKTDNDRKCVVIDDSIMEYEMKNKIIE